MSDPLSIAAGVVGIITAAAQTSLLLTKFIKSTIEAPHTAQVVLAEVSDIGTILSHLQSFLLGRDSPDTSRTCLLKVEKLVTIVSGCVLTFSELEKLLDGLKTTNLDVLDRLKWVRKESAIVSLIQRLQDHKASLSLVLNILNGQTISEAKASVDGLHALIEQCFPKISSRVLPLEAPDFQNSGDADRMLDHDTDSLATIQAQSLNPSDESAITSKPVQFDFSDDLQNSRVYRRNQAFRTSVISALTRSAYSLGCSFFSDLSMAEVSNISVINLLITEGEIFNPTRSSQTWSTQTNEEALGDRNNRSYGDRKSFQLNDIILEPIPRDDSSTAQGLLPTSTLTRQRSVSLLCAPFTTLSPPKSPSYSDGDSFYSLEDLPEGRTRARDANILDSTSSLPLVDPLDPPSPSKTQAASLPASHGLVEKDIEYPCKGCGEILEEGEAFELAGNRWHMDCFRCNTCGNVVDSNTDLLLISDGLFVCNDCRYSCSVCNSKIEDMAILTEDEAFCAPCFKCLRCKKKIESLKYGQTSLGFFCVDCFKCRYCKKMENLYRFRRSQEIIIICRECRESRLQTRLRKALPENDQSEETISNTLTNAQHLVDMESPKLPLPGRPILTDPLGRAPLGRAITLASAPTAPAECAWNFF